LTTAIVVQARVGSTRLPGKVLKPLGEHTVLEEVLRRCRAVKGCDVVVCAIPDQPEDSVLEPIAERAGAVITRGSAQDVLDRYAKAAAFVGADVVMRVTSDCPLIDPGVCADVLSLRETENADYACNNQPRSFPHGLDCEAFTREALDRADAEAASPYEREHVTPWLRTHPGIRRAVLSGPGGSTTQQRWTLDFPEDYAFLQRLFLSLPRPPEIPHWRHVLDLVMANPDLALTNAAHRIAVSV
jgi:glutamate-1-semialdehyde 2,1-aminomutase/spore coat polysaccharide biosynthesis protein SpsF